MAVTPGVPCRLRATMSKALVAAFAERDIKVHAKPQGGCGRTSCRVATLDDAADPYDLFLGVTKHRAPAVIEASGMAEGGWLPVNPRTLETKYPNVYAIGDVANTGTPKAGVFAEGAAKAVASSLIARIAGTGESHLYGGAGSCYIEFAGKRRRPRRCRFLLRTEADRCLFRAELVQRADKNAFGATRKARWFGL